MKKVMILLVIALTANVMMAQKKDRTETRTANMPRLWPLLRSASTTNSSWV